MKKYITTLLFFILLSTTYAENGYRLWLRFDKIHDSGLLQVYRSVISGIVFPGSSVTLTAAKLELVNGLQGLLAQKINIQETTGNNYLYIGTSRQPGIQSMISQKDLNAAGKEGFIIRTIFTNQKKIIVITANTDVGVLYGVFHFLRLIQTHQTINHLSIISVSKIKNRILDHLDNHTLEYYESLQFPNAPGNGK
jgi:alpha-glucuronidase